jgi:phosphopantetheinyl transferase (holo-ACP synthase)
VIGAEGAFTGNDVVDLEQARRRGPLEPEWIERHLTDAERFRIAAAPEEDLLLLFWTHFAAKEAASKAFAQAGLETPRGGYRMIEVDLDRRRVTHLPSGAEGGLLLDADSDRIHAIALVAGGEGWREERGQFFFEVGRLAQGRDASDYARELLAAGVAARRGSDPAALAVAARAGFPCLIEGGRWLDWSVSLSHAGRFVAWSCLVPRPL